MKLDAQLLNQLSLAGPVPASDEQLSGLPIASFIPQCFGELLPSRLMFFHSDCMCDVCMCVCDVCVCVCARLLLCLFQNSKRLNLYIFQKSHVSKWSIFVYLNL